MLDRKVFAGACVRALRAQRKLTQSEMVARLEISTSYVNQLESNLRPLTATVMFALASGFNLDLSTLMTDASDRLVADLREALADSAFGDRGPNLQEIKTGGHQRAGYGAGGPASL